MPWYIFGFLSALFIGLRFVTTKKVLFHEHSAEFLAILAIINFILVSPLVFAIKLVSVKILGLIFIEALVLTAAFLFEIKSFREFRISTVAPLLNLSPLFLVILAYIFLGEHLNTFQFIGIIILIGGAYLLEPISLNHNNNYSNKKKKKNNNHPLANLFSSRHSFYLFSALILLSVVALLDKVILGMIDVFNLIFYSRMFFALDSFIFLCIFYDGAKGVKNGFSKVGIWIFIVALFMVLGDLSFFKAVSLTYVSLVIPIRRLATLFAALVGGKLFKEEGIFRKAIACIIMIGGAILIVL